MSLSVQNKNFLALLNRLDIDVKQFPDKTFDGLFENVPEDTDYFFNWFIENITPDNVLTQSEQGTYFQLESTQSLPLEGEIDYVLSSSGPDFTQLMSLDVNYVNNFLPQDLDDLSKNYKELSHILTRLETNLSEIMKKQSNMKQGLAVRKKQLEVAKEECHHADLLWTNKLNDVKMFLLEEPHFSVDLDSFKHISETEEIIFQKFKTCKLLEDKVFHPSKFDKLSAVENDVACVDTSLILSEGFLREKRVKIELLTELLQKKKGFSTNSWLHSYLISNEGTVGTKILEQVKVLESEIFERVKALSHYEIKRISDEYLSQKMDLVKCYTEQLNTFKDLVKSSRGMNSWLVHILLNCIASVENTLSLKKQLYSRLSDQERSFSNDITNLGLRKQRFKEASVQQSQHPLLLALKNVMNLEPNPDNNETTFKNIYELMLHVKDDSYFINHKIRTDLQSSIKMLFDNTLCGPTSELLFAPAELVTKLQNSEERERELAQAVKRLASKYVDAKALISRTDRKKLLSWIQDVTSPQESLRKS